MKYILDLEYISVQNGSSLFIFSLNLITLNLSHMNVTYCYYSMSLLKCHFSTGDSGGPAFVEQNRLIQVRAKSHLFEFMFELAYCLSVQMD